MKRQKILIAILTLVLGSCSEFAYAQTGTVVIKDQNSATAADVIPNAGSGFNALAVSVVAGSGSGSNAAASATGAAVPADAGYTGANVSGTLRGVTASNPSGSLFALDVNVASVAGTTTATDNGVSGPGVIRVTIASDSTGQVKLAAGTAVVGVVGNSQASTTSGQSGPLIQCATTTAAPSYSTAQTNPVSCDTTGALRVNSVSGVAQGSTTSGQVGTLNQGAVTTSPPVYTTAQTSPISLDTAGNLRVALPSAVAVTDPCDGVLATTVAISQTASTKLISAVTAKKNYICRIVIVAGVAEILNVVEGTGSTCGTSTVALAGSTTAANGMSFAANGGLSAVGAGTAISGIGTAVDTCLTQSGSSRVAGWITYTQL